MLKFKNSKSKINSGEIMNKLELYILKIIEEKNGRIEKEKLTERIRNDYDQNKGPYSTYGESYYMRRFGDDLSNLIKKGLISERNGCLEAKPWVLEIVKKLPWPLTLSHDAIQSLLHDYLSRKEIAKLDMLRLAVKEVRNVNDEMKKLNWSEKTISVIGSELKALGIFKTYSYEIATDEIKSIIKGFVEENEDKIIQLSLNKKDEGQRLFIRLIKEVPPSKIEANIKNIANVFFALAEKCRRHGIEVVSYELDKLKIIFNKKLYLVSFIQDEVTDIPYFDADIAIFLCRKVDEARLATNFWSQYNDEKRQYCLIYDLFSYRKFTVITNSFLDLVEQFLFERYGVSFAISTRIFDELYKKLIETTSKIKQIEEEFRSKQQIDQGFTFTEPNLPWELGGKLSEFLSKGQSIIRLSNPYFDDSTFDLIKTIKDNVKINLLVTRDERFKSKVERGQLSKTKIEKIIATKRIELKLIPNLHARFIVIDNDYVIFLSPDLQTTAITSKYQYLFWTSSRDVVQSCIKYFDIIWNEAEVYDLIREIEQCAKKS